LVYVNIKVGLPESDQSSNHNNTEHLL
jgi:hypothetical protein